MTTETPDAPDAPDATDAPGDAPDAPDTASAPGRIVLLTASHRVAPGLLSWPAWQTLRAADRVLCADPGHPQLPYLAEAGVDVEQHVPAADELVAFCAGGRTAVVLPSGEGDQRLTDGLARLAGSNRVQMPDLELLPGSYDLPGARLLDLVHVMDRIRRECPWSSRQTHEGLAKYGIEEAYELVEAIEAGDRSELREELGDVLLQVVFHSRIAQEAAGEDEDGSDAPFSIDDVAATLIDKLIHRHPHVFGDESAETPEDVKATWLRTKAVEKQRASVTEGIPLAQPALALAAKLASRARGAGLDVAHPSGDDGEGVSGGGETASGATTGSETASGATTSGATTSSGTGSSETGSAGTASGATTSSGTGSAGNRIGYELLALAARAEAEGTDPETALRAAARTYRDAILAAEKAQAAPRTTPQTRAQPQTPASYQPRTNTHQPGPDAHQPSTDAHQSHTDAHQPSTDAQK
ncbi:nucleoside triphosphate pyrophosphohydrolase [Streptomyces sp. CA-294286]|uniref:nucleoside triphosphate pyrophosphohydrolase n=1 Tax=Streptomyces sp. CA-294286 TaxID=3240070 RepID=UPI003D8ECB41